MGLKKNQLLTPAHLGTQNVTKFQLLVIILHDQTNTRNTDQVLLLTTAPTDQVLLLTTVLANPRQHLYLQLLLAKNRQHLYLQLLLAKNQRQPQAPSQSHLKVTFLMTKQKKNRARSR